MSRLQCQYFDKQLCSRGRPKPAIPPPTQFPTLFCSDSCTALYSARKRPSRVSLLRLFGDRTRYNLGAGRNPQCIEIMMNCYAEPNWQRFARFETKAIQRLKIGFEAVSGVRSKPLTPFEIKRNFGAQIGLLGVCNRKMAEGVGFEPTLRSPVNTLSKRAPSATRPSLRKRRPEGRARRTIQEAGP